MLDLEKPGDIKSFGTSSDLTASEVESFTDQNGCSLLRFDSSGGSGKSSESKFEEEKMAVFLKNMESSQDSESVVQEFKPKSLIFEKRPDLENPKEKTKILKIEEFEKFEGGKGHIFLKLLFFIFCAYFLKNSILPPERENLPF